MRWRGTRMFRSCLPRDTCVKLRSCDSGAQNAISLLRRIRRSKLKPHVCTSPEPKRSDVNGISISVLQPMSDTAERTVQGVSQFRFKPPSPPEKFWLWPSRDDLAVELDARGIRAEHVAVLAIEQPSISTRKLSVSSSEESRRLSVEMISSGSPSCAIMPM